MKDFKIEEEESNQDEINELLNQDNDVVTDMFNIDNIDTARSGSTRVKTRIFNYKKKILKYHIQK